MHVLELVDPLHPSKVANDMGAKTFNYLLFLTRKEIRKVKGCGCADGRKYKAYVKKKDAAASTVTLQTLLISYLQDITEARKVTTCDIPGVFLQTDY